MESFVNNSKELKEVFDWLLLPRTDKILAFDFQCESRDLFQARLDNLYQQLKNPLLIATCGEIGNNSFDHNLGGWKDISGLYFRYLEENGKRYIVLADRGQGVRKTLSKILPDIKSDVEAVNIAFTQVISGRSPEQRGNGLKFVASSAIKNNWKIYFHSGKGIAHIEDSKLAFSESPDDLKGCLAIIRF